MEAQSESLMARLYAVHDPRRREGRRYALAGLLGILVLAAVQGQTSLRGMWQWGCAHWAQVAEPLDLWGTKGPPVYGTVWNLLAVLEPDVLVCALGVDSGHEPDAVSVDGKQLRGRKRASTPALQLVNTIGQHYRQVLAQAEVRAGDQVEAVIALL
jgi:hypothetical protein